MDKALLEEFPPITDEQWQAQVLKDLKGQSLESLTWETVENIGVQPYYRTAPALSVPVRPVGEWLIRQDIIVTNETEANAIALDALKRGCTALSFSLEGKVDLERLLKDILIEHIHTDWKANDSNVFDQLAQLIAKRGLDAQAVQGSISAPDKVALLRQYRASLSGFKLLAINAFEAETLTGQTAQQLAEAVKTIETLADMGIDPSETLPHLHFNIEVGTDYFFEIARIRVLRALWLVVCRQYVADYQTPAFIHATNKQVAPEKDGYYEMIRQTTQALSAVIGGADSLGLVAHVAVTERSQGFQERIARNVQLILQHESHLDRMTDPAAGSWYLESLTAQLAEKVWQRFVALSSNP